MNLFDLCVYKNLNKGSGGDVDVSSLVATENKTYNAGEGKAYNPVVVNVPTPSPSLQSLTASHNGYFVPSSGYDGFSEVTVDVATPLETLSATENGTYTPSSGYEGFSEVTVNVPLPNNAYLLESQKDDVVTIQHGAEFDMPKLIASIEPQQDLHGYDSPWVGGAGKNKLPMTVASIKSANTSGSWSGNVYTFNNVVFTIQTDSDNNVIGIKANGTANATSSLIINSNYTMSQGSFVLNGCPSGGGTETARLQFDLGGGNPTIDTGSGASFTLSETTTNCRVFIRIGNGYNAQNLVFKPMIRLSSVTDSTFAPYSNECPISGWTACNVVRTGKNLFDKTATDTNKGFISGKWINQTGNTFSYGDWSVSEYIRVDGEKIAVSGMTVAEQVSSGRGGYCCYDKYKNVLGGGTYNALTQIITLPTNTEYIRISVWNENKDVCQLELGSSATTYEEYNGNTYTINFVDGSNPLTVYGGTLDVLSGLLTITDGYISSYNGETLPSTWISDRDVYAEGTTPTTGAEVCYKLATPQTYQLTPTEVKSLLGVNNIFADTGKVDVQIWTKEVTS